MTAQSADALGEGAVSWCGPLDVALYDRRELVRQEQVALAELGMDLLRRHGHRDDSQLWQQVQRLVRPLEDAHAALCWQPSDLRQHRRFAVDAMGLVLVRTCQLGRTYWQWSAADWTSLAGTSTREFLDPWPGWLDKGVRPYVLAYAYLLGGFAGLHQIGRFHRSALAWRVFGRDLVEAKVSEALAGWGYHGTEAHHATALCQLLLINRSPFLHDLTSEFLLRARRERLAGVRLDSTVHAIHRGLAELGHVTPPPAPVFTQGPVAINGAPAAWTEMVERWYATSTLTPKVRGIIQTTMAKTGRWLAAEHPDINGPADWTRQTCASWVAAVDRMRVGEHVQRTITTGSLAGEPLKPKTKAGYLRMTRTFFRDLQEWEWIPRRFDPGTALPTPRSIKALTGPDPRVIADDVWAKLLWAGLNLTHGDLSAAGRRPPTASRRRLTLRRCDRGEVR